MRLLRNRTERRILSVTLCAFVAMAGWAQSRSIDEAAALLQREGELTLISQIQGSSHLSPLSRERVSRVPGIVTAIIDQRGFFMQSPLPDDRIETSEGIYVNTRKVGDVSVGDLVILDDAKVEEYYVDGSGSGSLPVTRIKLPDITVLASGFALPEPVVIGRGGRIPPSEVISNDSDGNAEESFFDPEEDGMDFYESLEGMLVTVNDPLAVGTIHTAYGEIHVVADNGVDAGTATARGGLVVRPGDFNPERIAVDLIEAPNIAPQPKAPAIVVGDRFSGSITGIIDYAYDIYKILPIHTIPDIIPANLPRETTDLDSPYGKRGADELSIASFNVLNLAGDDPDSKFVDIAETIAVALQAPDLLILSEIQDSTGAVNDGVVDADRTASRLIAAIVDAGGPEYAYIDVPPQNNRDGGEQGGNIRVGFLYLPDRIELADASSSDANPGRIGVEDTAFVASRKPLIATFQFGDKRLTVIGAHLNSKSGDGSLFGRTQPPVLGSEEKRVRQANVIAATIGEMTAADPGAYVIIAGDLNDYWFAPPLDVLKSAGMKNLVELLPEGERYSYVYMGNSQTLDHILVSGGLFDATHIDVDIVHRYSEYLYGERQSDHDPIHAVLTFSE